MSLPISVAPSAIAARRLGYERVGALIAERRLSPDGIRQLFKLSAQGCGPLDNVPAGTDLAVIVFAGSVARRRTDPARWDGAIEAQIATDSSSRSPQILWARAAALVMEHCTAIAALAGRKVAA